MQSQGLVLNIHSTLIPSHHNEFLLLTVMQTSNSAISKGCEASRMCEPTQSMARGAWGRVCLREGEERKGEVRGCDEDIQADRLCAGRRDFGLHLQSVWPCQAGDIQWGGAEASTPITAWNINTARYVYCLRIQSVYCPSCVLPHLHSSDDMSRWYRGKSSSSHGPPPPPP